MITPDLVIRPPGPDPDWAQYQDVTARAFGFAEQTSLRAMIEPMLADGRCLAAFDGAQLVGSALFFDMRQYWLGRAVPMAGVAGVAIAPEYRGRGVGRALMTALTELMAERGYPLSVLYPATMVIYRSLGWEMAGHRYEATMPGRALLATGKPEVRLRRPGPGDAAEVLEVIGRTHELARDSGPVTYDEAEVRRFLTRPGRYADTTSYAYLADDGFVGYRWRRGNEEIFVDKAVASSAETTRALWAVVGSHSSVAETVRAQLGPQDPFWWLQREEAANVVERESWMLRLLDAPAAIAARGFPPVDLHVPLQITDDLLPANSGRWQLTVRAGAGSLIKDRTGGPASTTAALHASAATAQPAESAQSPGPPLTLGSRGLAALYAGTPLATLRRAGLATGGSPEDDPALDGAFAASPYMLDGF
jgi:predicted acetyltransferase